MAKQKMLKSIPQNKINVKLLKHISIFKVKQINEYKQKIYLFGIPVLKLEYSNVIKVYVLGINLFQITSSLNKEQKQLLEHLKARDENILYEIAGEFNLKGNNIKLPHILSLEESLKLIMEQRLSVARLGDAEFNLMLGTENVEHKYWKIKPNKKLQDKLANTITSQNNKLLVCLWNFMGSLEAFNEYGKNVALEYMPYLRPKLEKYLTKEVYGNAFISRPYMIYKDKSKAGYIFDIWKKIWNKRNVVIVEGEFTKFGLGNDLLNNTISVKRIICPSTNAWAKYEEIKASCLKQPKDTLFLLALGITATVLAADLAAAGFQAIDIGHLDIEYEWYKSGAELPEKVNGKQTNDAAINSGIAVSDIPIKEIKTLQKTIIDIIE